MKRFIFPIIAIIIAMVGYSQISHNPAVESIYMDRDTCTMYVGDSTQLSVIAEPLTRGIDAEWESTDASIVSVHNGTIYASGVGNCTIIARYKELTTQCEVTVKPIVVTVINMSCQYNVITINETQKMNAAIVPANATYKTLQWTSSNPEAVSVDQRGNIKGLAEGVSKIRATAHNGIYNEISIEVREQIYPTSIILNKTSISLLRHETKTLEYNRDYTVLPANATSTSVTWSGSDSIVTITEDGHLTALKGGKTAITATTENGLTATINITVEEIKTKFISVKNSLDFIGIATGTTKQIEFSLNPGNTTDLKSECTFSSSNKNVATVDENGLVTIVGAGSAYIIISIGDCSTMVQISNYSAA